MKRIWVLFAFLMLTACQGLPVLQPPPAQGGKSACPSVFTSLPTRYIHALEARTAGQTRSVMIGVTLVDPRTRRLASAIISPEGLSLFEAASEAGVLNIERAVPPFDSPEFAKNLMEDIALIFLAPAGAIAQQGLSADGRAVCRWHPEKGGWVDVSESADQQVRIRRYSEGGRLERTVAVTGGGTYAVISLQASGLIDYALLMTLIESETVDEEGKDQPPANQNTKGKTP